MMPKPKAIQWLEDQTGQDIDYTPEVPSGEDRHLSVRLSSELSTGLEVIAAEGRMTVSQLVRELLAQVVGERESIVTLDRRALAERLAADVAEVGRRLVG
jgi:predicted transcriptional regulator